MTVSITPTVMVLSGTEGVNMRFRYEIDGVIYVLTDMTNGVAHYKALTPKK